jgi:F0F1-type ATP synthase membrane subunit b/b'
MATEGQGRAGQAPALTSLPRVEDLGTAGDGYDREQVREAFEAFRRHTTQLQVQLRVLQAAGQSGVEPTGHAVRMDALHMIRAAAEMADTIERDAQTASASQLRRTEEEVTRRQRELQEREAEVERYRSESERQRTEMLNAAKAESRQTTQEAQAQAAQEVREAESRAARLLEQARHQATELTNSARAEVEQTLEWARSQAGVIINRAQEGAEQLLAAAGLGDEAVGGVAQKITEAAEASTRASRGSEHGPPLRASAEPSEETPEPPAGSAAAPGPPPPGSQGTGPQADADTSPEDDGDSGG